MTEFAVHHQIAILFFPALLLTLWLTPPAIRLSRKIGAFDRPEERKVHTGEVSRLGGIAMVAGMVLPLLLFRVLDRTLAAFLAGALIVSLTGLLDDIFRIRPATKFAGEVLGAAAFVFLGGISLTDLGDFIGTGAVHTGWLAPAVTIFCMVGVMNALNLSDGLDGLAGGIAAIACIFLGAFAYWGQDWTSFSILLALLGAILGFLRYNSYPAHLFMGDAGSLLLGYSLAAVTVMMSRGNGVGANLSPVTVAGILALPITDTLLVMVRRLLHRGSPFRADRTHLHHRLLELGIPHAAVVPILYVGTALFGFQAWFQRFFAEPRQFLCTVLLAAAIHGTVFLVHRAGWRWEGKESGEEGIREEDHRLARILGKSVRPMGWAVGAALLLPALLVGSVPRPVWLSALGMGAGVAFLFPWNRHGTQRTTICYGLIFAACLFLLGSFQFLPGTPRWVPGYLAVLCTVLLGWVLLKMRYCGCRGIVLLSGFETLMISAALAIPLVLFPALALGEGFRRTMLVVCFEAVTFLLAMKVMIRRHPGRNHLLATILLVALALIGLRGMLGGNTLTASDLPRSVAAGEAQRSVTSASWDGRILPDLPAHKIATSTDFRPASPVPASAPPRSLR